MTDEFFSPFHPEPELTDLERRRRVVRLCCSFMRNLAYHRAGMKGDVQGGLLLTSRPNSAFWRECHSNFFDICVLEWCKLFVDRKRGGWGEHHWQRVASNTKRFEEDLYSALAITADEFSILIENMQHYRNKFVAHLDGERMMHLPRLEIPKRSVEFLHAHIVLNLEATSDWFGLPSTAEQLLLAYSQSLEEAARVYNEVLTRR